MLYIAPQRHPVIPLPLDRDGVLVWQPSSHRGAVVRASDAGILMEWRDGSDSGVTYTERGAGRVLDVLRLLYA